MTSRSGSNIFQRTLLILWICQFFVMAGMSSAVPFLPLFIRELGVRDVKSVAVWSGWVFAAPFLVSFLLTPLWGALGDKYGRKLMTTRALIGLAVSLVLIGFSQNVYQLFFFRVLQGILSGFYPAALALAAAEAPKGKTSYALSSIQSANVSGNIIGPLFGGTLSLWIGYRWVFIGTGIMTALLALLFIMFVTEKTKTNDGESKHQLLDNYRIVLKSRTLLTFCALMLLAAFAESALRPLFVLFVESISVPGENLAFYAGAILSMHGFSSAGSAFVFGKKISSQNSLRILAIAFCGTGAMNVLQAFTGHVLYLFPIRFILGLFYGLVFPVLFFGIAERAPAERKSGVMGIASSFQILGNFLGPMSSGYLAGILGFAGVFHFSGLWFLVLGGVLLYYCGALLPEKGNQPSG